MTISPEKTILWQARPSHLVQLPKYLALGGLGAITAGGAFAVPSYYQDRPLHESIEPILNLLPIVCAVLSGLLLLWLLFAFINHQYTRYTLTLDTLYTRSNFLLGSHDTLWCHLIRDVRAELPLLLRIIGLGHVVIISRDMSHPELVLRGVRNARSIKQRLNDLARKQAAAHRVLSVGE